MIVKDRVKLMPIYDTVANATGFPSMPVMTNLLTLRYGGRIKKMGGGRMTKREVEKDTVPAILQIGEIVIPRDIAKNKLFLGGLRKFGYNSRSGRFQ